MGFNVLIFYIFDKIKSPDKEMLSKFKIQRYKSLFDTEIELEPLTVFIGPNGSGKSNICEALAVISNFIEGLISNTQNSDIVSFFTNYLSTWNTQSKFWQGEKNYLLFEINTVKERLQQEIFSPQTIEEFLALSLYITFTPPIDLDERRTRIEFVLADAEKNIVKHIYQTGDARDLLISNNYLNSPIENSIKRVNVYDFSPIDLSREVSLPNEARLIKSMDRTGKGITNALLDILLDSRDSFMQLEERLCHLIPNIKSISLSRGNNQTFALELVDKYSGHHIPAKDVSDGTLRILALLTAIYQKETPSIICFEELENGVHPWLLHKLVELLQIVATEGINGKPVQVLITTHSPLLLNYVKPEQIRAVELDKEGKTQVHKLPTDSVRFQKALEAYDNNLGELWFTNIFGGNPT